MQDTMKCVEFKNWKARADTKGRLRWGVLKVDGEVKREEVRRFTVAEFIERQLWLKAVGVPFKLGVVFDYFGSPLMRMSVLMLLVGM
ncbi:hypothetical protein AMTR_s00052p00093250 [Amborella trichopoda]|uniref:Uncharacterized protein n=1 Tax=Amborella trichopoda TaxID=13333 RepID=U5D7N2_AMBTC|nr:hypothetical protein AMTR_s00052p00093250 [Amborella trichopoda]